MNVTIVDYQSGNISSVINSFTEVAKGKVNLEITLILRKLNQVIRSFAWARSLKVVRFFEKCVRLIKGDFEKTEYNTSPIDQAERYKYHGFKNLHIVDLDGALTGETVNLEIVQSIVNKFDLKVEIGGGIRSLENIKKYINVGVEKVILGSGAIKNKNFLKEACEKFKNKIALGLDEKDGNLSVSGWRKNLNIKTIDYLKDIKDFGVSRIIYTDINRDGMKVGPNLQETVKISEISNCPVVISGGVSSINDIKKAKKLNNKKIEGIIVGKAIYDEDINLNELSEEIDA